MAMKVAVYTSCPGHQHLTCVSNTKRPLCQLKSCQPILRDCCSGSIIILAFTMSAMSQKAPVGTSQEDRTPVSFVATAVLTAITTIVTIFTAVI